MISLNKMGFYIKKFVFYMVIFLLFVNIGLWYGYYTRESVHREVRYFVNLTLLNLLTDWSEKKFLTHASIQLRQRTSREQWQKMNTIFLQLGELLNYHGAVGKLFHVGHWWGKVVARYEVQASFQKGYFVATVTLISEEGRWKINGFYYEYTLFPMPKLQDSVKWV